MADLQHLTVGKIVNTHGIRGELKVISQTHFADERFAPGSKLIVEHPVTKQHQTIEIVGAREHKGVFILRIAGYDNINQVEHFKGSLLKIATKDLDELEEGQYYHFEIVGCTVTTDEGVTLGIITEILSPGANDVWVVQPPKGKQILLPVIDDVVISVDPQAKQVVVHVMEGLI